METQYDLMDFSFLQEHYLMSAIMMKQPLMFLAVQHMPHGTKIHFYFHFFQLKEEFGFCFLLADHGGIFLVSSYFSQVNKVLFSSCEVSSCDLPRAQS